MSPANGHAQKNRAFALPPFRLLPAGTNQFPGGSCTR
jgi:hypothetical protein